MTVAGGLFLYSEGAIDAVVSKAIPTGARPSEVGIAVAGQLADFDGIWPLTAAEAGVSLTVFQSANFLSLWQREIGRRRGVKPLLVSIHDASGCPLMLLPLALSRRHGARVLSFLDGGAVDYNGPVLFAAAPDWSREEMSELWVRIAAGLPEFDIIDFSKMLIEIGGRPNPLMHLGAAPWDCSGHAVRLVVAGEGFKLPNARASRRKLKRLNEIAPTRFSFVEATQEARSVFDALIAHKSRRFTETRVPGFDRFPGLLEFYRSGLSDAELKGEVRLAVLYCGDTPIAEQWCLVSGDRLILLVCGNAGGTWSHCSPGRLLNEHLITWAASNGFRYVDFGIGDEAYKAEYCNERIELAGVTRAVTARGRAVEALWAVLSGLRTTRAYQLLRNIKYAAAGLIKR